MNQNNLPDEDLMVREDNPYSIGSIYQFDEGDYLLDGPELNYNTTGNDRYYTVKQEDTLWQIAHYAYGNSKWYWLIALVNDIEFALELPLGKTLLIPDLETARISM